MKPSASYATPRRLAAPKKQVRLDLRRSKPKPPLDEEAMVQPKGHFWLWVSLVALFHVLAIVAFTLFYKSAPTPPPEQFMSLLPQGDLVKGTPGTQSAPKLGPTTPAPSKPHEAEAAMPQPPAPVTPPTPKVMAPPPTPVHLPPVVKSNEPSLVPDKPLPKPTPPKPKVKLTKDDLKLVDGTAPVTDKPVKPKPHIKKPVVAPPDASHAPDTDAASNPDSTGLSKEQVAQELGEKLQNAGVANATHTGASGAEHVKANPYADFYASIRDQVMSKWEHPNVLDDTAIDPIVRIHVEKDGRVPVELITLERSSGNPTYDATALAAAQSLGYLLQPLPDGCPPDIPITFKLNR